MSSTAPVPGQRPPLLRRLVVRIYLVGLLQFLVVMAGVVTLVRQSHIPEPWLRGHGEYVVAQILPLLLDRARLQHALAELRDTAGARMTLYQPDGTVLATNVDPPLPLPGPATPAIGRTGRLLVLPVVPPGIGPPRFHLAPGPGPRPGEMPPPPPPQHFLGPVGGGVRGPPPGPFGVVMLQGPEAHVPPLPPPPPPQGWAVLDIRPPMPGPGQLAFVAGLVVATVGISSALLARSISRPLGTLSSAATRLGAGDLAARAALDRTDELGEVGRAFDGMAERIVSLLRAEKALLAGVSHELRTPLSRIRVALELAEEGDVATARASLADITDDLGELERLVNDLLIAARLELGRSTPGTPVLRPGTVDAGSLVAAAAERFLALHPEHRLDAGVDGSAGQLHADGVLVARVLNNLLDNAAKYSAPSAGWVRLHAAGSGSSVRFTVQDRGAGISPEDLPHVFTPFFRADRSRSRSTGGFGLGLSLSRTIAEAHGGTLTLSSRPGEGTEAVLSLPRSGPLHRDPPPEGSTRDAFAA